MTAAAVLRLSNSPRRLARVAGVLYLLVAVFSVFAIILVRDAVYVPGDAATTARNVVENSGLVRAGVVADLFQATVFVFLAMTLYMLLKHVHAAAALAMLVLVAIATSIMCLDNVFQFASLRVATDPTYAAALGAAGSDALVLLLLDTQHHGFLIAQIFFGLWLVPLGYLVYKSDMFPRALGVVLVAGGVAYLIDMLAAFLAPDIGETIHGVLVIAPTIAEVWMLGYLLIRGIRTAPEAASAPTASRKPVTARAGE